MQEYHVTLEQEVASIASFALQHAGNPRPYYYNVPEKFKFPAMYFPQPEITTRGETAYAWYINIFAKTSEEAHEIGLRVLTKLKRARNLVPLIEEDGTATGKKLRLDDPELRNVDTGAAQLTVSWTSRRPYDANEVLKMQRFHLDYEDKNQEEVNDNGDE